MSGICYTGPFLDSSGYGEATRNFIRAFHAGGADLKTELVQFTKGSFPGDSKLAQELSHRDIDYDIKVLHVTPDLYKNYMEKGKYHIGHLFWETNKLPDAWVAACNKMDEIWVGAYTNSEALKESGVKVPIQIFPEAIDVTIPEVEPWILPSFEGFVFYSIFEWTERKNPKALLNAFWKEFKGLTDVCLLLKTHKGSFEKSGVNEIIRDARMWRNSLGFKKTARVFICTDMLSKEGMHRLHETGDCYASAHRGEGWAIPPVEATLHRNPVIAVKYGGVYDYWTTKHMHIVKHKMVDIDKVHNKYYAPGMQWADADEKSLRAQMRKVYDMWHDAKRKRLVQAPASAARKIVLNNFNYKAVGGFMMARIDKIREAL